MKKSQALKKNNGQVFTPEYMVKNILDFAGYSGYGILGKHIIDNSCGDGAFLTEIISRYCQEARRANYKPEMIKAELETYVHGIEVEDNAYERLIPNLNDAALKESIMGVNWDIIHGDALKVTKFNNRMDYVVGNPPYVRVRNLNDAYESVKHFSFAQEGMTDLYLVFYELGLRMLGKNGILCYITPNSWLTSLAGKNFREYIRQNKSLAGIIDIGHYQPFDATTYTLIALFQNDKRLSSFSYYAYDSEKLDKRFVCDISFDEANILGCFYLADPATLSEIRLIKTSQNPRRAIVKNGFATLADKVFIDNAPETSITIPIIKASTGKWHRGLYPYDSQGCPISKQVLFSETIIKDYFEQNKCILNKGENEENYVYYGRTQALKDVQRSKYAISPLIKGKKSIKLNYAPSGCGVYSGFYILTEVSMTMLKDILLSDNFVNYVKALKKYKSNGYYAFSSKDLEQYLNFKINNYNDKQK